MTTLEFCETHFACDAGREWALYVSSDMAVVWDTMIEQRKIDWLCWVAGHVLTDKQLRLLACQFVRETPLGDGRKVWDLLEDERSRNAIVVAERFAHGDATKEELFAASDAAWASAGAAARDAWAAAGDARAAAGAAKDAAWDSAWAALAARDAALAAALDAAWDSAWAARDAAWDSARSNAIAAQCEMFRRFENPFKKGETK